jgi:hypothetical protein
LLRPLYGAIPRRSHDQFSARKPFLGLAFALMRETTGSAAGRGISQEISSSAAPSMIWICDPSYGSDFLR